MEDIYLKTLYNSEIRIIIVSTTVWKEEIVESPSLKLEGLIVNITPKYNAALQD